MWDKRTLVVDMFCCSKHSGLFHSINSRVHKGHSPRMNASMKLIKVLVSSQAMQTLWYAYIAIQKRVSQIKGLEWWFFSIDTAREDGVDECNRTYYSVCRSSCRPQSHLWLFFLSLFLSLSITPSFSNYAFMTYTIILIKFITKWNRQVCKWTVS